MHPTRSVTRVVVLEARAKHRYVGELLTNVFGNLPDADIDTRARGVLVAMLDRFAGDVLSDGELKPRDVRDVVQAYDLLKRGAIAAAQESRRQAEFDVARMGAVAESATWIKQALGVELDADPALRDRLQRVVDQSVSGAVGRGDGAVTAELSRELAKKSNWSEDVLRSFEAIFGINARPASSKAHLSDEQRRERAYQKIRDNYGITDGGGCDGSG